MTDIDKELEKEKEKMALNEDDTPLNVRVRKGRPSKVKTIKSNLDLTQELIDELDEIANYLGTTRQGVIKAFLLQGLDNHYQSRKKA